MSQEVIVIEQMEADDLSHWQDDRAFLLRVIGQVEKLDDKAMGLLAVEIIRRVIRIVDDTVMRAEASPAIAGPSKN